MRNLNVKNILEACGGELVNESAASEQEISSAVIDSRLVEKDSLFFATKGERVDGHDFIKQAFEKGAALVICEHVPEDVEGPCIIVKDSLQALKDVAEFYRRSLDIKVVGITGSVGKTSTKEFIASVLSEKYNTLKTEKNYNNEIGLPLTILKIREEHQVAVLEMGISDFGEMSRLTKIARPDIAVITNIGTCHLENLKDRDGVLKAKTEIFESMDSEGEVCLFGDDDKLITIQDVHGKKPIFFGTAESNDVYAKKITNRGIWGSECTIATKDGEFDASIALPGKHMVYNALAATAVGRILGLSFDEIKAGIEKAKPLEGRSNILSKNNIVIIDDCYNANPMSMKSAIDLLCEAVTPTVAILGDMFELGEKEKEYHREVGDYARRKGVKTIICIGPRSRDMADAAREIADGTSDCKVYSFLTKEEFISSQDKMIYKGDTVLVKASHGMGFDKIITYLSGEEEKVEFPARMEKLFKEDDVKVVADNDYTIMKGEMASEKEQQTIFEKIANLKPETKKKLAIAGGIVLALLAICIAIFSLRYNAYQNKVQGTVIYQMGAETYGEKSGRDIVYARNGEVYTISSSEGQYGENLLTAKTGFTSDGKYIYYLKRQDDGRSQLYCAKKNKNKEQMIAANVTDYQILSKGVVCYAANNALEKYDVQKNSLNPIADHVVTFQLNKKKNAIIFLGEDGSLSYIGLKNPDSLRKISDNVSAVIAYSESFDKILYRSNNSVYAYKEGEEPVYVAGDGMKYLYADLEGKGYVYSMPDGGTLKVSVFGKSETQELLSDVANVYEGPDCENGFLVKDRNNDFYFVYRTTIYPFKSFEGTLKENSLIGDGSSKLYFIVYGELGEQLMSVGNSFLDGFSVKINAKVEDNYCVSVERMEKNHRYVLKNGENGRKDLYCDNTLVARNVKQGTLQKTADGSAVVFLYDETDERGNYRMGIFSGKKTMDGGFVYGEKFEAVSPKKIIYRKDTDKGIRLMMFNGKKEKKLANKADDFIYIYDNQ